MYKCAFLKGSVKTKNINIKTLLKHSTVILSTGYTMCSINSDLRHENKIYQSHNKAIIAHFNELRKFKSVTSYSVCKRL